MKRTLSTIGAVATLGLIALFTSGPAGATTHQANFNKVATVQPAGLSWT